MLTIRDEQFRALADAHLDRDLVRYLRQRFPATLAQKSDSDLDQIGRASREVGAQYNITADQDIGTIADFIVMYGFGFENQQWANEVLSNSEIASSDKVEILRARVRESGTRI